MSDQEDFEGEIEFLDEDAEIVQQCVLNVENKFTELDPSLQGSYAVIDDLLVEIEPSGSDKRIVASDTKQHRSARKRKNDDDSDYDPKEDLLNPQNWRKTRRVQQNIQRGRIVEYLPKRQIKKDIYDYTMEIETRKKLQLKIPDYDDPLCLPVRSLRKDATELRKVRNWNNLCLEHFKCYDTPLRANKLKTVASKRIMLFKNLSNKSNEGKMETTLSAKLIVANKNNEKTTEVTETVLPKYREKKLLNIRLTNAKKPVKNSLYTRDEVILTKEVHKDEETLVVYKPMEALSLVYKMFKNKGSEVQANEEENKRYLKEVACVKLCAPCYQTSWRAFKKINNNSKIQCIICKRPCISMYNMLAHMKSHPKASVRACKKEIAQCLASVVEYHYKCKLCDEKFFSIKTLRSHVKGHKGTGVFTCEVCNQSFTDH